MQRGLKKQKLDDKNLRTTEVLTKSIDSPIEEDEVKLIGKKLTCNINGFDLDVNVEKFNDAIGNCLGDSDNKRVRVALYPITHNKKMRPLMSSLLRCSTEEQMLCALKVDGPTKILLQFFMWVKTIYHLA